MNSAGQMVGMAHRSGQDIFALDNAFALIGIDRTAPTIQSSMIPIRCRPLFGCLLFSNRLRRENHPACAYSHPGLWVEVVCFGCHVCALCRTPECKDAVPRFSVCEFVGAVLQPVAAMTTNPCPAYMNLFFHLQ